jgi:maltose alpha-D-glucosyltransferase / alpha-amylase
MPKATIPAPDGLVDRSQWDWYRDAVIYELHVRSFADANADGIGDFRGLTTKLDYLRDLGVTAIWLLPFYPSPLRDDGYDIAGYVDVNPAYGTMRDFRAFLGEAHKRGLRVITELVINHTSDKHPWFQRARRARPGSRWRNWYVWSGTPDRYAEARIIFQDFETSNWSWDPVAGAYYWHRFYSQQPDLNFENPEVEQAVLQTLEYWLGMGVDGLRLDAVPYLYEAEGTNCENLPATHDFLKRMRKHIDQRYPDRLLLAEANQWPEDAAAYFGDGDECHMNFHFPLMPRLYLAVRSGERYPVLDILQQTPALPPGAQWALFLRNHDELTLEMVTDEERDYMWRVYARDREARINLGIRRRLAPLLDNDRARIELLNGLLLSLPGTPVIYYGDEIGMGDNVYLGDRDGVRTPMQWSGDRNAGFSTANPQRLYLPTIIDPEYHYETVNVATQTDSTHSLLWWMRRILALRNRHHVFGRGDIEFLHPDNPHVLVYVRSTTDETVLVAANLARHAQSVELDLSRWRGATPVEMSGGSRFPVVTDNPYQVTLGPYAFYWLALERAPVSSAPPDTPHQIDLRDRQWAAVFAPDRWDALAVAVRRALSWQVWTAGSGRPITQVRIVDAGSLIDDEDIAAAMVVVEATHPTGDPTRLALPMSVIRGERRRIVQDHPHAVLGVLRRGDTEALLVDGSVDPQVVRALANMARSRRRTPTRAGLLLGRPAVRGSSPVVAPTASVTVIREDHSNSLAVIDHEWVLKMLRVVSEGISPDQEIAQHLTRGGFTSAVPLQGSLEYQAAGQPPCTVAVLRGYVPHEGDMWTQALDDLTLFMENGLRGTTEVPSPPIAARIPDLMAAANDPTHEDPVSGFPAIAAVLGRRLGELHLALAGGGTGFTPETPSRLALRSTYQSLRNGAMGSLRSLDRAMPRMDEKIRPLAAVILRAREDILEILRAVIKVADAGQRIRVHGNMHLEEVLWTGRDVVFVDFEGEATSGVGERRLKWSPLRDVAGLVRSMHYVTYAAEAGLRDRGMLSTSPELAEQAVRLRHRWYANSVVALLAAYLRSVGSTPMLPSDHADVAALLEVYALEKALREVSFELHYRREWLRVPLLGVAELVGIPLEEVPA